MSIMMRLPPMDFHIDPLATLREVNYDSAQLAKDCSLRLRSGSNLGRYNFFWQSSKQIYDFFVEKSRI